MPSSSVFRKDGNGRTRNVAVTTSWSNFRKVFKATTRLTSNGTSTAPNIRMSQSSATTSARSNATATRPLNVTPVLVTKAKRASLLAVISSSATKPTTTSVSNVTSASVTNANTGTNQETTPDQRKRPKITFTKMSRSRVPQCLTEPKTKEDILMSEQPIQEQAKRTREKVIADASSIFNLLKENGICTDLQEAPTETMESNRELPLMGTANGGMSSNEPNRSCVSERCLPSNATINAEVVDVSSMLKVKQEPTEMTSQVQREVAERSTENVTKVPMESSILNLLNERGICSDPQETSMDTIQSNGELPLMGTNGETRSLESNWRLPPRATILAEVVAMASRPELHQQLTDTISRVDNMGVDLLSSARWLELMFQNDQIHSHLEVVDQQIAKYIDLRLFLLRKKQFVQSEMNLYLSGTGRSCDQAQPPTLQPYVPPPPPPPSVPRIPPPSVPSPPPPAVPSLPPQLTANQSPPNAEIVVTPIPTNQTQRLDTEAIVVISDESDIEMLEEVLPKPKSNKKRLDYEVSTFVIIDPSRSPQISSTTAPHSNYVSLSDQPVTSVSVTESREEGEAIETSLTGSTQNPQPTTTNISQSPAVENTAMQVCSTVCETKQIEKRRKSKKRKRTEDTPGISNELDVLKKQPKKQPKAVFVDLSSIRRLQIESHRDEVLIIKGSSKDLFTCSSDGIVKRLRVVDKEKQPPEKLVCKTQYVHNFKEVSGMDLLCMKSGSFIIVASKSGILQKFLLNSSWCFTSVNTKVQVTCMVCRWNLLFIGTTDGTILNYCAIKFDLKSLYSASKGLITCVAVGSEGACRLLYVGSMENDICVRDANSGLLNRFIKLKPYHHPRKIEIVQDLLFTLVSSRGNQNADKIFIHQHDGQILHLIKDVNNGIQCMSVSSDKTVVFYDRRGNLYRFDYDTKKVLKLGLNCKKGFPTNIFIHKNLLIAGTKEGHLECWMDGSRRGKK